MGTTFALRWGDCRESVAKTELYAILASQNAIFSTWEEKTEISRFNRASADRWIELSPDLGAVTLHALELARATDGAFDPSLFELIRFWGFDRGGDPPQAWPTPEAIRILRDRAGFRRFEWNQARTKIRKNGPKLGLNVTALVEGHALDLLDGRLRRANCANYLLEIGGELFGRGLNRQGDSWRVGINLPLAAATPSETFITVRLQNQAVATSGTYRNRARTKNVGIAGREYSHILDGRTGYPVEHRTVAVTVIAPKSETADALATTLLILGADEGLRFVAKQGEGIAAIFSEGTASHPPRTKSDLRFRFTPNWPADSRPEP